ncbi:hypothetical protein J2W22_003001 [Sphingomonas kyeonggiensis]|uniref:hypothetical protein n=1 Tax=Sphingomonas kyeonggiensis TaxID=1268553 RepID=UPI0027866F0E|nr:hypothetical protein [Sphingomonas kyeonggiensis]MDQ0250937.1 hypothetical protein [Sphingomonas kyeonggiensis]
MVLIDIAKEVAQRVELAARAFDELAQDLDAWPGAVASGWASTPKKDPVHVR